MSYKIGTYLSLFFLICLSIGYFMLANESSTEAENIGSSYFPKILAITLFILCIISILQTYLRKGDKRIELPNIKKTSFTFLIIIIFLISWQFFGYFYINMFVFLFALLILFRVNSVFKFSKMIVNMTISLGICLFVYFVFDYLLFINF